MTRTAFIFRTFWLAMVIAGVVVGFVSGGWIGAAVGLAAVYVMGIGSAGSILLLGMVIAAHAQRERDGN
jgi:hypothetical protein